MRQGKSLKMLLVGAFDSSLKWGAFLENTLNKSGHTMEYCLLERKSGAGQIQITREQFQASGAGAVPFMSSIDYLVESGKIFEYDAAFLIVDGRSTEKLVSKVRRLYATGEFAKRPVLIAGYAGLVLERWLGGMADRIDADFLCVNSRQDYDLMKKALPMFQRSPEALIFSGLTIFENIEKRTDVAFPPKTILFAAQPTVPEKRRERLYTLTRLLDYARRHPDRTILFKPRHKPGEAAFNTEKFSYLTLLDNWFEQEEIPENFQVVYDPITRLFAKSDLVVSVSSTAAPEAWFYGVPFVTIADFGFSDIYGGPFFHDSGRLVTFDQLENDELTPMREEWIERQLSIPPSPSSEILNRVEALIMKWDAIPGSDAMPIVPYRVAHEKMMDAKFVQVNGLPENTKEQETGPTFFLKRWLVQGGTFICATFALLPVFKSGIKAVAASSLISVYRKNNPNYEPHFLPEDDGKRAMVLKMVKFWDSVQKVPLLNKAIPFIATVTRDAVA